MTLALHIADRASLAWAQSQWAAHHYLRAPIDARCSVLAYVVTLDTMRIGALGFGRPESTRCYSGGLTYGSLDDVARGRAQHSRWEVINLARVWFSPVVQAGGAWHTPNFLPGYLDRRGVWRSTLASTVIEMALDRVVLDYLLRYPPCFLDEPYQLRACLSYCDRTLHRGVVYRASGFKLARTNARGIETYAKPLRQLAADEDQLVRQASAASPRSQRYRAQRGQLTLSL
jgi:hypothetical protein